MKKDDCSKHKKEFTIETQFCTIVLNPKQLARIIADLNYETLPIYIFEISKCFETDGEKDMNDGKEQTATALQYLSFSLFESSLRAEKLFKTVKSFMK